MRLLTGIKAKLYTFSFLDDFILIYPLYSLMFADNGLAAAQIASLFVIWSVTSFVCEIPAGSIADKFPRRLVLIAGIILRAVGYGFWLFMPNYLGFAIGFALWGIKGALTSGTLEALVYDELTRAKDLPAYAKVTGRMKAIGAVGDVLASLAAALFASRGYTSVLWLSIAAVIASGFAIYSLPKSPVSMEASEDGYWAIMLEGVRTVLRKPLVFFLVAFMSIVAGMGAADEYINLFLRERHFSNTSIVIWSAIIFTLGALGSTLAHKLENKKLPIKSSLFVWAGLLCAASLAPRFLAPVLLGLFVAFFFAVDILFNAYLQHHISDKTRATTTSVGGFFAEIFAVIGFLIVGFGANRVDYAFAFQLLAGGIVAFGVFLVLYARRHKLSI